MSDHLTAALLQAPGEIRLVTRPLPEPGPRQLRVRLEGCGVCASNLPVWEGREWFDYPLPPGQPGHEGWGLVEAVGREVTTLQPGQRVAMLSGHAYASHDLASADEVVPLPPALEGQPFPGEPLGCAMNIWARSRIEAGQTVAIIGIGFLGALLTQLASQRGAHRAPAPGGASRLLQRPALHPERDPRRHDRGGHAPSMRLFEAAACGTPILSDWWEGLDTLFEPGREILIAHNRDEALSALRDLPEEARRAIGERARARVMAAHTAAHRAAELEGYLEETVAAHAGASA